MLILKGGRIISLPYVLHIPRLVINFISINKMNNAGAKKVFEKDTCRMV